MSKCFSISVLLIMCLFFLGIDSYSQTKDQIVVPVDLDAGTIGKVPFDQKFKLGSFKTSYDKIRLTYTIKDPTEKPNYFSGGQADFSINKATGIAMCSTIIGPLHPNVVYKFNFTVTKAIVLSPEEEAAYRKEVFVLINKSFKDVTATDQKKIDQFKKDLDVILKKYAKADKLVDADGNPIDVMLMPLFKNDIDPAITIVENRYYKLNNPNGIKATTLTTKNAAVSHFDSDSNPDSPAFFKKLNKALKNNKIISESFNKLLDSPINPSLADNVNLTARQYLQYLLEDPIERITKVVNGEQKIVGNNHDPASEIDKNSLIILQKIFEILGRSTVTTPEGRPYFKSTEKQFAATSYRIFTNYVTVITEKEKAFADIAKQEKEIPNLIKDAFITKEIKIDAGADIDVLAEKNPYIGLDAGVGYAFGSANGVFIYEGANFYLRPINRDADFRDLKGMDEFLKRLSFYLGIAQIITEKEDSFESLFGNNSLMVGGGFRLNRAFRLNVGGLLHYKKDPNPVIDDKKITVSPTLSLSVDIDLVKALGAVGEALNIN